ncbi:MAG TPA: SpoIIE family protein phosphatase [Candidatus Krumholzibacteria bacterium]|nr:SpoIIE family protein phosphatase [Candidatus Krumholzibacteria bacterium]
MRIQVQEDGEIRAVDLPPGSHLVGRSTGATLRLRAPTVSRRHAVLHVGDGTLSVEDLGSRWGTFVDEHAVGADRPRGVPPGAVLRFAQVEAWTGERDAPHDPARQTGTEDETVRSVAWFDEDRFTHQRSTRMLRHLFDLYREETPPGSTIEQEGCLFVRDWIDVDRVCARTSDTAGEPLRVSGWWSRAPDDQRGRCISRSIVDEVLRTGKVAVWSSYRGNPEPEEADSWKDLDICSAAAVPVHADPDVRGVLYVDRLGRGPSFGEEDLELLTTTAAAMATKREMILLGVERERAARIQSRMLPDTFPAIAGYEHEAALSMCRTVGGDFYDCVVRDDGRVVLIVGDVSGKGLTAALIAAGAGLLFRSVAGAAGGPARIHRMLHENLSTKLETGQFVAVFLAVLDPSDGSLCCVNAGLPYPLLIRSDGGHEAVEATGMPPALYGDCPDATEVETHLEPGDLLAVFTDGYHEATVDGEAVLGLHAVWDRLTADHGRPLPEIRERLDTAVETFVGPAGSSDDQTLVLLRRCRA